MNENKCPNCLLVSHTEEIVKINLADKETNIRLFELIKIILVSFEQKTFYGILTLSFCSRQYYCVSVYHGRNIIRI